MNPIAKFAFTAALVMIPQVSYGLCFHCNRGDWNEMDTSKKHGFVAGVVEETVVFYVGIDNRYKQEMSKCIVDMEITTGDLVDIVDTQYQDLEKWEMPPASVLTMGLRTVCLANINRARTQRGDELLTP